MTGRELTIRKSTELGFTGEMPGGVARMTPPTKVGRLVFWLFLLGLGLFGGLGSWAALAPMQSAVVASGMFRVLGDRQVVQHLEGGIIRDIRVKEGDVVEEGDVIAVLDGTRARASVGILNNQLASALSTEARIEAEFEDADEMVLSEELTRLIAENPDFADLASSERRLFEANKRMLAGQVDILVDRVAQLERRQNGVEERRKAFQEQLDLFQEELADVETLYAQGLVTKVRLLAMQRGEARLIGDVGIAETELQTLDQQIAELRERILQVRRDRLFAVAAERQPVKERIFDIRQRLAANQAILERLEIRAPRAGRIVGLEINTLGEVIAPGQSLLEIVPTDSSYVVQVRVRPNDIDQVSEGGAARVRLAAYNFRTTPPVRGTVTYVSADSLLDEPSGQFYFQVNVRIDDGEIETLNNVVITPGMQAQVLIATGEQTLVDYLLSPIMSAAETALTESD